jgi:hypothetical protein
MTNKGMSARPYGWQQAQNASATARWRVNYKCCLRSTPACLQVLCRGPASAERFVWVNRARVLKRATEETRTVGDHAWSAQESR